MFSTTTSLVIILICAAIIYAVVYISGITRGAKEGYELGFKRGSSNAYQQGQLDMMVFLHNLKIIDIADIVRSILNGKIHSSLSDEQKKQFKELYLNEDGSLKLKK